MEELMEQGLAEVVMHDKSLESDQDKKLLYMSYAGLFEQDFEENLFLNSVELDSKYETRNASSWKRFLNHNCVSKYIKSFLQELSEKEVDKVLARNSGKPLKPSEAMKLKTSLEKTADREDNSRIVVMLMPQKEYVEQD